MQLINILVQQYGSYENPADNTRQILISLWNMPLFTQCKTTTRNMGSEQPEGE